MSLIQSDESQPLASSSTPLDTGLVEFSGIHQDLDIESCPPARTEYQPLSLIPTSYRTILPKDRHIIQKLHETWFPVTYQKDFYDNLVHGRMCNTNEKLFSNLACNKEDEILACLVGMSVQGSKLNPPSRQLILPEWPHRHERAFYIMTLGTIPQARNMGLATSLIDDCIKRFVLADKKCGTLYLHVITSNEAAIRFYERLNFFRVQEIESKYTHFGGNMTM